MKKNFRKGPNRVYRYPLLFGLCYLHLGTFLATNLIEIEVWEDREGDVKYRRECV